MEDSGQIWHIYTGQERLGPMSADELRGGVKQGRYGETPFVFRTGWKDWKPLSECLSDLDLEDNGWIPPLPSPMRHPRAPRATIGGSVIIHNNAELSIGQGVNISASGVFIETTQDLFRAGETLILTCKIRGADLQPFQAKATVMRRSESTPSGYGLRFEQLDQQIASQIQRFIDAENDFKQ